jgi:DNA-binding phage protein
MHIIGGAFVGAADRDDWTDIQEISRAADGIRQTLNRESLYRQLSRRGNPSLASLDAVLSALGLKLRFAAG